MPGAWVDIDLSTVVFHVNGANTYGQYTAGAITSLSFNGPRYYFPGLAFNDIDTYEVEFTVSDGFGVSSGLRRDTDSSDAAWLDGTDYFLDDGFDAGTTLTLTVGPGIEEWDDAVAMGANHLNFNSGSANHVTAIRYRNMTEIVVDVPTTYADIDEAVGIEGGGEADWDPPVVSFPTNRPPGAVPPLGYVVARRVTGVSTSDTGFAEMPVPAQASKPRLRKRIRVANKDVTYFRDVPTPVPDTRRIMPLSFGDGGVLVFPQTNMWDDDPGTGDLWWLRYGKKVVIELVDADDVVVVPDYWIGYISLPPYPNEGGNWCVALSGDAAGRLSTIKVPGPRFWKNRDVLIRCANDLTTVGRPVKPRFPYSGIEVASRGGMDGLSHFNEHIVLAQTNAGVQWTCRWDHLQKAYVFEQKDTETVTATVYFDAGLVSANILPSRPINRVWTTAVSLRGERITNVAAPGVLQGPAPDFPGTLEEGDEGENVTVLMWQLTFTGYMDLDDHPGGFDQDVVDAVKELQEDAGLSITGIVNSATWDALFDLTSTRKGINYIHERPAAQRRSVEKFDRSATGAILGLSDDYDPDHIKSDADFDMSRATRRKVKRWARNELTPPNEVAWSGEINFNVGDKGVGVGGLIYGEDDGVSTLTSADVMDPDELVEGDVLMAPNLQGGTKLVVVGVERRGDGSVTAVVDSRGQDTAKAWENHKRKLDSQHNPARLWSGRVRQSEIQNDATIEWVDFCGKLTQNVAIPSGWSEPIPIFSGQEGTISRIRVQLGGKREFAMTVTAAPGTTDRWAAVIPDPLGEPPSSPMRHSIEIDGDPTGGTFTLANDASDETAAIGANASAGAVQAAIRALPGSFAGATVSGPAGGPWTVTMQSEADLDVGSNDLTGGSSPSVSVSTTGPSDGPGTPWYELDSVRDFLEEKGLVYAAGTEKEPCGYGYARHTGDDGASTDAPLKGIHLDDGTWSYRAAPLLYVRIFNGGAPTKVKRGWIFRQELDSSGT